MKEIRKDEEGFDDLDDYFNDHDNLKNQDAAKIMSRGGGGGSTKMMPEFASKPLVGRTPPTAYSQQQNQQQNLLFLNEYPTKRDQTPTSIKLSRHTPASRSKLRNSFSRNDLIDDDIAVTSGGIRSRFAQPVPAIAVPAPAPNKFAQPDSDEDEECGASSIRKRLGHSNITLPVKTAFQVPSVLKSIAMKPMPSQQLAAFKSAPLVTRSPLAVVTRNVSSSVPVPMPSPAVVATAEPKYIPQEDDAAEQHDFQEEFVQQEPIAAEVVEREVEPLPASPVFKKPFSVALSAKISPYPAAAPIIKKNLAFEKEDLNASISFANNDFQDDYDRAPIQDYQEQEDNGGEENVAMVSRNNNIVFSSSSGGLEEDYNPPTIDSENDDDEPVYEEDEEEEEIKPKKKSHNGGASKKKIQVKRQPLTIPQKYLDEGERIGPNSVKIPVERVYQEDDDGTRKSKRARIAPLAFWKNEKAGYTRRDSGISLQHIIRVFDDQGANRARPKHQSSSKAEGAVSVKPKYRAKQEYRAEQPPTEIKVINYATKQEEYQKIAMTPEMVDANRTVSSGDYSFQKVFSEGEFIASGVLELPHGSTKPSKNSHGSAMMFVVVSGLIEVKVHKTTFQLEDGGQFFVPRGNQYSISNVGSSDATLYFCHSKQISSF